ncbi:glycosyltransferase [Nitratidesulfovibrio termitidis]|uniref:glycosyltransferase n=1 Tax=Nitratidesulfovibrio termitidis TaxID=42252 RepID=UPI0018DDC1DE|nr:glycosyltransferase [Nitratidesulfovibrio termitidis]
MADDKVSVVRDAGEGTGCKATEELATTVLDRDALAAELACSVAELKRLTSIQRVQAQMLPLEMSNSLSCRLGQAVLDCCISPVAVMKLPYILWKIWRDVIRPCQRKDHNKDLCGAVVNAYIKSGFDGVDALLVRGGFGRTMKAHAFTELARYQMACCDTASAAQSARRAYEVDPRPFRRKWMAFRLADDGDVLQADALLGSLPTELTFSPSEMSRLADIRRRARERRISVANICCLSRQQCVEQGFDPLLMDVAGYCCDASILSDEFLVHVSQLVQKKIGTAEFVVKIRLQFSDNLERCAAALICIGKYYAKAEMLDAAFVLAEAAKDIHTTKAALRNFFWSAQHSGNVESACAAIHDIEKMLGARPSEVEMKRIDQLKRSVSYQLALLDSIPEPRRPAFSAQKDKICYVLHNSLPFSSGGYATRSHGIAVALQRSGVEVVVLTRPGFPLDIKPELGPTDVASKVTIDGVCYERISDPKRNGIPFYEYVEKSADAIEARLRIHEPTAVMSASNYIIALPTLIAARRVGIPFFYDVRGFWEVTRLSREKGYERSATYKVQSLMEARVANSAERVFTLTEAMRAELISRGVTAEKIDLMPNACDAERFVAQEKDKGLAARLGIPSGVPVIGYVGTFVDYEGLDDLAAACGLLKEQGCIFRLLLVGSENTSGEGQGGGISHAVSDIARQYAFSDWLILAGRVPHEEVERYYSLIDIAPFPRKPLPVCEMVSPMKPLEAFAMEKAVVVSSVRALQEMVTHEHTGLVFKKGSVQDLADSLARLVADPALRQALGSNGRKFVEHKRTWEASTRVVVSCLRELSPYGA